jgi:hypothetical protein
MTNDLFRIICPVAVKKPTRRLDDDGWIGDSGDGPSSSKDAQTCALKSNSSVRSERNRWPNQGR